MPTPTRKQCSTPAQAVVSRKDEESLCPHDSHEALSEWRFTNDFCSSHATKKASNATLMLPRDATDDSSVEQESAKDESISSEVDEEASIDDAMPIRDDLVGSPDTMQFAGEFFSSTFVQDTPKTPVPWQISRLISSSTEKAPAMDQSLEQTDLFGFVNKSRFTNEILSPRIPHATPKAPKSARISPRFFINKLSPRITSHENDVTVDEFANSSKLSSVTPCSTRGLNVTCLKNHLDESTPNIPGKRSPRESVVIIKEIITLDTSSDDENQISKDVKEVANKSVDTAEYHKYLQLKAKYGGKRNRKFLLKSRAQQKEKSHADQE